MEHVTVSVATASPAQHSVTEFEGNYIERLKLIVLDGTVNDIEVSINRLFLIDNLDVTINQKNRFHSNTVGSRLISLKETVFPSTSVGYVDDESEI